MRKRTVRVLLLVAGGLALGVLAIAATNYVMHLDQQAGEVGALPAGAPAVEAV